MGPLSIGVVAAAAGGALALAWGASSILAFLAYSVCGAAAIVTASLVRAYGPDLVAGLRCTPPPASWRPRTAFR